MRQAVIEALADDPAVAAVVGHRIYGREGPYGGVSRDRTPEAFTPDGDLLPSLVVVLEGRRSTERTNALGPETLPAEQTIAVWALQHEGYDQIKTLIRAVRWRLHRDRLLRPVTDPVRWVQTLWSDDSPETLDAALGVPAMVSRFRAVITEEWIR